MYKINDVVELKTERMSFGSAAVARLQTPSNDRPVVVFVKGAAPNEVVKAKITGINKNFWDADIVEILNASPNRVKPPCEFFETCGGCQWQHLNYDAQVEAKKEVLLHQIHRTTKLPLKDLESITELHPATKPFGYRTRVQVRGNPSGLGFFEEGSRKLQIIDNCIVCHPTIQETWTDFVKSRPLSELSQRGLFKVEWTLTENGQILEAINKEHAALGFTQINPEQNAVLTKVVSEAAQNERTDRSGLLLDLYAGSGNLSKDLCNVYQDVLCVEAYSPSGEESTIPGTLAPGQTLIRDRVEKVLKNEEWKQWGHNKVDCVIADPPRSGLDETAPLILKLNAHRIILVSCEPSTLARDLTVFLPHYDIMNIHLIDMFPQTYHIETVVELVAKAF